LYAGAGIIPGLAAALCFAIGAISVQQTIALALAAAMLTIGGLAAAADRETGRRRAFQAGFRAGAQFARWRSAGSRQRNRS
jgi:hypothetical protein